MNLLIFGATGSIGRSLVEQALERGHAVAALVRDPAKLDVKHNHLEVVQGDVLDAAAVEQAMQAQEAVLCALGAGSQGKVRTEGTHNIIRAMKKTGLRRLVCLSSLGVGESVGNLNFFWKHIMFGFLLRKAYADHVEQERFIQQSSLDWTVVRPSAFTNGERTGQYRHGFPATDKTLRLKISRADVADFMLRQLTEDTYLHQTPGLSY